jgi:hypothetical protein
MAIADYLIEFKDSDWSAIAGWEAEEGASESDFVLALKRGNARKVWYYLVERGENPNALQGFAGGKRASPLCVLLSNGGAKKARDFLMCIEICLRAGATLTVPAYEEEGENSESVLVYLYKNMRTDNLAMQTAEFSLQILALLLNHYSFEENDHANDDVIVYVLLLSKYDSDGHRHFCEHSLQMLLKAGINPYAKQGPLTVILSHVMSTDTCVRLCTLLLEAHPGLIEWDKSALINAILRVPPDSLLLTELLLVRGADPNKRVRRSERRTVSALYVATRQPPETSGALLELLMQYGADPFYFDDEDQVPFIETVSPTQAALILDVFEQYNNKTKKRKMRSSSSGSASLVP